MLSLRILMPCLAVVLLPAIADAHNCQCRNRGTMFELGETSCLRVDGRNYLARCEMKLNVSSWTEVEDGCPVTDAGKLTRITEPTARVDPLQSSAFRVP